MCIRDSVSVVSVFVVPAWHIWNNTTWYEWYASGMVTLAEAKLSFGYPATSRQEVEQEDGRVTVSFIADIANSPRALATRERLEEEITASLKLGGVLAVVATALLIAFFWLRGRGLNRGQRLRGAEMATPRELEPVSYTHLTLPTKRIV